MKILNFTKFHDFETNFSEINTFHILATIITISGISAGTVAVLLGAKILALKGLILGGLLGRAASRRRHGRSSENLGEAIFEASLKDQYDCSKMLICQLHAKPATEWKVITK